MEANETPSVPRFPEALYRGLLEAAPDALIVVDERGTIVLANAQATKLFGYEREELIGASIDKLLPASARERHKAHLESFAREPRTRPMGAGLELYARHKSGRSFPVEVSLSPFKTEQGLLVSGAIRDVSLRKQFELKLQRRALQQTVIAELGVQALRTRHLDDFMNNLANRLVEALEVEFSKVFELRRGGQELYLRAGAGWRAGYVGRVTLETGTRSLAGYTLQRAQPVIAEDLAVETRFNVPAFLKEHEVRSSLTVIIHGSGSPYGVLGVDSTRKHRFSEDDVAALQAVANLLGQAVLRFDAEEALDRLNLELEERVRARTIALEESEERFAKAFHASPAPTFMVDLSELRFIDANKSFLALVEHGQESVVGRSVYQVNTLVETEKRNVMYGTLREGRSLQPLEVTLRTRSGGLRTAIAAAEPIELGGRASALFTLVDITERKRTEEELMRAIQATVQDAAKFSQAIMEKLVESRGGGATGLAPAELTPREKEVLALVALGRDNAQIARQLELAPQTVHNYVSRLYEKLGVSSRSEVIVWARQRGYVTFEP